ncbi:MAG: hypothetical protein BGP24_09900 [Lysobacterales bacterium 69-70]|nr:SRPBCC family protein [Xanthomonadaceae bacterium]ODU33259.1 MAG: hypothetical protein ABS97_12925 [Xanthomonadaceae bacterium SCN 69-320]ODV20415.1 MAG: hypothetical protein ABT27_06745 [Xanthomonadaceae bacterium SCN 69-25]OJZ00802.1 MAG: hypothetical protein BGP24_09900 [Xanthomonadales bacterium 69-70]
MKTVNLQFLITQPATSVYEVIADFPAYETFADAVRKVELYNVKPGSCESFWEVKFRDGLLRWHERDAFYPEERRIHFSQTKGDLAIFDGGWHAEPRQDGTTTLTFHAVLDLGLPQLASLLEPIAVQALRENIASIVNGLFEGHVQPHPISVSSEVVAGAGADRALSSL